MDKVIQVSGLTKSYGAFLAVDHIPFDIRAGKTLEYILSSDGTLLNGGLYTDDSEHQSIRKGKCSHEVPAALNVPEHAGSSSAFQAKVFTVSVGPEDHCR
jgi:hypothetical protein